MPITASYSSGTRKLSVLGDATSNSIIFSRDLAGLLFVNAGAVPITSGPATAANTDLIEVFGLDLHDVITLDETNGTMPAASISGGNGDDTLTGGSNGDTLNGDAGADLLLGRGGIDTLNGGADGDTLTGGAGNDMMNGDAGNDRMIWNPGDDDDVLEGGADTDTAEINGGAGAETFSIAANGTRVLFQRTDAIPFALDIGTTELLILNAGGGNDVIDAVGNLSTLIGLGIDGGAGDDTINAGNGADIIFGGDNNDFVDGNQGADVAQLGAGNDVFKWDPGDGNDIVEGGADADELLFNGSNASETIDISPNGGRVRFFRDIAAINMDLNDLETITYNALGGADNIVVSDMTGTDLTRVNVHLASQIGGGDGQADRVTVNGTNGNDTITAISSGADITLTGLTADVLVSDVDNLDHLIVSGGSGDDVIDASNIAVQAQLERLELLGGLGGDVFIGSGGADLITGGDGDDVALMGGGDDTFVWNPGDDNDIVEGQAATDTLDFNGAAVAENIAIDANGGHLRFSRDVAAVTMDLNDVERIIFDAGAGIDSVTIGDLSGTDAALITVNLAGTIGGSVGDAAIDAIVANGTGLADTITLAGSGGAYTATGLPYTLAVNQSEAADTLLIQSGIGADVISAAALLAGNVTLTLSGGGGNDTLTGSAGADILQGGTENDTLTGGPGADTMSGEDGADRMVWNQGDGSDVMEGGNGASDLAEINGGSGDETFTIAANGTRVAFSRVTPAPFALDIGTTESLVLHGGDGNDTISTSGNLAALIVLTLDGGAGNDTILGGNGVDVLTAGDGNDFVDGNQGNDFAFLGPGADIFQWDPGDGNDVVEGAGDTDTLIFNGNSAAETFSLVFAASSGGTRTSLSRNVGAVVMDVDDVENFTINAGAGIDAVNINSLVGTGVAQVTVNLAGTIGGSASDAQVDTVTAIGTSGADSVDMLGIGSFYSVLGLPALVAVNQSDATDQIVILGGGGDDSLSASALPAGVTLVTLDGGTGNDSLSGSAGADTLFGGDNDDIVDGNAGADTAFLGNGNDVFRWDPGDGSDIVEGQADADELRFNGSNSNEIIAIGANGGRGLLTRDIGAIVMDMDDVETITYNALGGADNITIGNLAGTDVTRVVVNLAAASGGADGAADTVTVNASAIGDIINVDVTSPGVVTLTGLFATVEIRNFDSLDRLIINAGDGNDVIDATGSPLALTVFGGIGDDTVTGGNGFDSFILGAGNNSVFRSLGGDFVDPTGGTTTLFI